MNEPSDGDIFIIPHFVRCEKCGQKVHLEDLLLTETCPTCKAVQHKENYGKYFGIIRDVKDGA